LLSAAEVTACYENASVPITDQWSNCVTDLDFAFANPEQSLKIRSRSGAGDATASTGISQITPIEQLNTETLILDSVPVIPGLSDVQSAGLHFDGATGNIDIASPPDLGTSFSFEFIVQADSWGESGGDYLVDFGVSGRFAFRSHTDDSFDLGIYDGSTHSFGVKVLDDLKVHHLVVTVDGTAAILYDNGNQVGTTSISTPTIDLAADARIGSKYNAGASWFDGTFYRARFFNRTLSAAEVTASFENSTVPFADQYGSQTNKVAASVDQDWGTAQADTGNDANDRATFNAAYVWNTDGTPVDISVASNVFQFTTNGTTDGVYYPSVFTAGKKYRVTLNTGTITGNTFKLFTYASAYTEVGTLTASTKNVIEFTVESGANGYLYIFPDSATVGTIQLDASSVDNEIVEIGCVADYDLAFANPTQSTLVQDRAGAADGTASSGVTQVTPLVQLNATAARIGTSAATPADGELLVSGGITIDGGGSIGMVNTDRLYISAQSSSTAGGVGLQLDKDNNRIVPCDDAGAYNNNVELGDSTLEFTNLWLSGSIHCSGTVNADGIAFQSATTGSGTGTGYTLDSYETGIFTPVVADAGTGGNAASAGAANGRYTKVGNRVYCQVSIINITTTGLTAGNLVYVRGLPFTSISTANFYSPVEVFQGAMTSTEGVIHGLIHPNTDYMSMYNSISGAAGSTSAIVSQITSGSGDMYMSFQYETAL